MSSGVLAAGDVVNVATGRYNTALGEVFPIAMVDGTTLLGPGDHSAVVEGEGEVLQLNDLNIGSTTIEGMSFHRVDLSSNWEAAIIGHVSSAHGSGELHILDNHFTTADEEGAMWRDAVYMNGYPSVFVLDSNVSTDLTLLDGWESYERDWVTDFTATNNTISMDLVSYANGLEISFEESAHANFLIQNNTLTGCSLNFDLDGSESTATWSDGALIVNGSISDNTIDGGDLDLDIEMTDTDGRCRANITLDNNTVTNAEYDGIDISIELTDDDENIAALTFLVTNNTVDAAGDDALDLSASVSESSSELYVDYTIDNNTFVNAAADGMAISMEGDFYEDSMVLSANFEITNNTCTGNESDGIDIYLEHTSTSALLVRNDFYFRGNTLTGNGDSGVYMYLEYSDITSDSVNLVMDFGTVEDLGNNSIHSNMLNYGSSSASSSDADGIFITSSSSSSANLAALTFPALGNTWGAGEIEDNIYHQFDNEYLPLVTFESGPPVAPVAIYDAIVAAEDTASVIDILANDTDVNGNIDRDSVVITQVPSHGSVTLMEDGRVEYMPNVGWLGADTFNYYVSDNTGLNSNTATVEIMTEGGNAMPMAVYDARATEINDSVLIDILTNDGDPDGDELNASSVVIEQMPHKGTVVLHDDGTVTYTPNGSLPFIVDTTDTFNYSVGDVRGARSNIATVEVRITRGDTGPAGSFGANLSVEGLVAGQKATFIVNDAKPGSDVRFAYSTRHGSTATQWGNLELGGKVVQMGTVKAGANGKAVLELALPASAAGATLWFQALDLGHGILSNAVSGTVQ